jgi:hypothetical protein
MTLSPWRLALVLAACDPKPPPPPTPPVPRCPAGMIGLGGGIAWLSEYDPAFHQDQAPPGWRAVAPFCVDPLPFPGLAGARWPEDGLEAGLLPELEDALAAYGRRLCTVDELLWATAEGPANLPYVTGQARGACEDQPGWDDMRPLGGWPGCKNRYGLREGNTASSWARAGERVNDWRTEHRARGYALVGGTARTDTFYAPTNFGLHAHDPGDPPFSDDQLRVCADPAWGGADDAAWATFQQAAALQGTFAGALDWHARYGPGAWYDAALAPPLLYAPPM